MCGINIMKSEAPEVLSMKIQYDVCWNRHVFQCLCFLRQDKVFWSSSSQDLHPKEKSIRLSCVSRCVNVYFDVNDGRVSNSIYSLEQLCNLACVPPFCRYCKGFCSSKIRGFISLHHDLLCNSRLSCQVYSYVVNWPVDRILRDRQNSFFSRTIRIWNPPRAEFVFL